METLTNKLLRAAAVALSAAVLSCSLAGCGQKPIEEPPETEPPVTTTQPAITLPPETTTEATTTEPPPPVEPDPLEKYMEYYEQNSDFVGWISIPGITHSNGELYIDYPVLQTTDNSFYIDHDFDKDKSSSGAIYADYKVPITGFGMADNVTLYGHSMANGTYFRRLLDYKDLDTVKDAYIINFDTRWEEAQYIVVACFLVGIHEDQDDLPLFEYFKCRNFDTEEDYNYFYDNIMLRNYYTSGVECEYGDQFLTLSTCSYEFDDSRFVVVARKLHEGEDPSVYEDTYEKNPDRHRPSILHR